MIDEHYHPRVYADLIDRLDAAFEAHASRFGPLDRDTLRGGFVTAMAIRSGQIALELQPCTRKRAAVVVEQLRVFARAAEIHLAQAGPEIRRDQPGVN